MSSPVTLQLPRLPVNFVPSHEVLSELKPEEYTEKYHDLIRAGDQPVVFVDSHSNPEMDNSTIAEHLAHIPDGWTATKVDAFISGKNIEELTEAGYYIGPCVVALCSVPYEAAVEIVRLAIFRPNPTFQRY